MFVLYDRINSIQELTILQKAKGVTVVNWATNSKGTQLTDHVFRNSPKALHFIDQADIKKREEEFLNSLKSISEITNVLSINENKCNCLAREILRILVDTSQPCCKESCSKNWNRY